MSPIPKVFHRVWLGGQPMPDRFVEWGRSWTDLHPGWEMRTWTEAELPRLRNAAFMERAVCLAQRADLARYEILLREGGWYVDADLECIRTIEGVIGAEPLVVTWLRDTQDRYSNAFFGCVPGHAALERTVAGVPAAWATEPWFAMGPPHFTANIMLHEDPGAVRVLPRAAIQPLTYEEYGPEPYTRIIPGFGRRPFRAADMPPWAYAINHHASKWFRATTERLGSKASP